MKHKRSLSNFKSAISGKEFKGNERVSLISVREGIINLIKADYPEIDESMDISISELDHYRKKYIQNSLHDRIQNISTLEQEVIEKIKSGELVSLDTEDKIYASTFGQRVADKVASFGGSWTFIICFLSFMALWVIFNVTAFFFKNFDPYPFILLNLILSCLAALQAPVIMMSQNRVEEKDRFRAKEDYKVNLKAEIEIQALHEKIDFLIDNQQQKLFEFQDIQVEMLNEITTHISEIKANQDKK